MLYRLSYIPVKIETVYVKLYGCMLKTDKPKCPLKLACDQLILLIKMVFFRDFYQDRELVLSLEAFVNWWPLSGLNTGPDDYESSALTY